MYKDSDSGDSPQDPVTVPDDGDDERSLELHAVQAIYPELVIATPGADPTATVKGSLDVAVNLVSPISLVCQDSSDAAGTHETYYTVNHLPPLAMQFELPPEYPAHKPPVFRLQSSWLAPHRTVALIQGLLKLWDEAQDQILYAAIDSLYQQAETGFGASSGGALVLDLTHNAELKDALLAYDMQSAQQDFDATTFKCAICQYPKKGKACTQLSECRHVFCTDCLKAYLEALITQGYIAQVKCPDLGCPKPSICETDLVALVGAALSQRYHDLLKKKQLEKDPHTIVCPRSSCQALIRPPPGTEILCVCPSCLFAFCRTCTKSWHGYYTDCVFKTEVPEADVVAYMNGSFEQRRELEMVYGKPFLVSEVQRYQVEESFKRYMSSSNICKCPQCEAPIERMSGCNKMTCDICKEWFCFLCGESLIGLANPYDHYSQPTSPCYAKLFLGSDIEAAAAA